VLQPSGFAPRARVFFYIAASSSSFSAEASSTPVHDVVQQFLAA